MPLPPGVPTDAARRRDHRHHHRHAGTRLPVGRAGRHRPPAVVGAQRRPRRSDPRAPARSSGSPRPGSTCTASAVGTCVDRRHRVVHRRVPRRRRQTACSWPSRPRGGCSTPATATRSGRVAARRDRERRPERRCAGAERHDRPAVVRRVTSPPTRPARRCHRPAPSTAPPRARSPRRWRSCPPRRSGSGSTRRVVPTSWSTCRGGSPVPPAPPRARHPTNVRPPECTTDTEPTGSTRFFRTGAAFTGRRLPALVPPARRPRAVVLPGRLRPRPRQPVDVRAQRRALVQNGGCFSVLTSGTFAAPGEFLFAGADATAAPLVLAARRATWAPTACSTCSSPRCARTARRTSARPSRSPPSGSRSISRPCRWSTPAPPSTRRRRCTGGRSPPTTPTPTCTPTATASSGGTRSRSSTRPSTCTTSTASSG